MKVADWQAFQRLSPGWEVEDDGRSWIRGRGAREPVKIASEWQWCVSKSTISVNPYNNQKQVQFSFH